MCARTPHKSDIISQSLGQAKAVRHAIAENFALIFFSSTTRLSKDFPNAHRCPPVKAAFLNVSKRGCGERQLPDMSTAKQTVAFVRQWHTCIVVRRRKMERANPISLLTQLSNATVESPRTSIASLRKNWTPTSPSQEKTGGRHFFTQTTGFTGYRSSLFFLSPLAPFSKTSAKVAQEIRNFTGGKHSDEMKRRKKKTCAPTKNFPPGCLFLSAGLHVARALTVPTAIVDREGGPSRELLVQTKAYTRAPGHCSRPCANSRCVFPPRGGWRRREEESTSGVALASFRAHDGGDLL